MVKKQSDEVLKHMFVDGGIGAAVGTGIGGLAAVARSEFSCDFSSYWMDNYLVINSDSESVNSSCCREHQ
jgi:hypothetical protein